MEDVELFKILINNRQDKLYKIAYSYVKNEQDAMDCVQDAVLKGLENSHKLKEKQYFDTWIIRILINICKDKLKNKNLNINLDENLMDKATNDMGKKEEIIDLLSALDNLQDEERLLIYMKYFEEKKISDISNIVKIKENTVKSKIRRALTKLKVDLN